MSVAYGSKARFARCDWSFSAVFMHARSFIPIVAVEGFFQDVEAVLGDGFGFLNFFFKRENFEIEFDDEFIFGVGHFG